MNKRIVICGRKGSGKSTVGEMLQRRFGADQATVKAFADPLKLLTHSLFRHCVRIEDLRGHSSNRERVIPKADAVAAIDEALEAALHSPVVEKFCTNSKIDIYKFNLKLAMEFCSLKRKDDIKVRDFLQILGTDVVRALNVNAWVDTVRKKEPVGVEIFTDGRFLNELACGDVVVYVERPSLENDDDHESEKIPVDKFKGNGVKLINDSNLNRLEEAVWQIRF